MWYGIIKRTGVALAWTAADTEAEAWSKLRRALAGTGPCSPEDAEQRGYTVKFIPPEPVAKQE